MIINTPHEIVPLGDKYVLSSGGGKYFIVSANSLEVINSLVRNSDIESAYSYYCSDCKQSLSIIEYKVVVQSIATKICGDESRFKNDYLNLKIPLIGKRTIGSVGRFFSFLYSSSKLFWIFFAMSSIINLLNFITITFSFKVTTDHVQHFGQVFIVFICLVLSPIIHEAGHISGCKAYNADHGGVGLGFYLIFPVFYSDVSGIWMISRSNRLKVNLGGIFFELIYSLFLIVFSFLANEPLLRLVSGIIFISLLRQLNPFLRYDGYWILSDLTNVHNLRNKSKENLLLLIVGLVKGELGRPKLKILLLSLYGFISYLFVLVLLIFIFLKNANEIISFPITLFKTIKLLILGQLELKSINPFLFFICFMFYYIVIKWILKKIKIRYLHGDELPN